MRKFDEGIIKGEMNAVAALLEDRFKNAVSTPGVVVSRRGGDGIGGARVGKQWDGGILEEAEQKRKRAHEKAITEADN